ncbi:MAG: lipoate--protein ligase family protein, partial [Natronomonas sp.]|nr:lipoate--protein ligase family protein [Natronomonas sp.]
SLDPAHDLVAPDGRKIAGNAQYRTRDAIVQHGSLTFDSDPARRLAPFVDPPLSADAFADRVGELTDIPGVDIDRSTFVDLLETKLVAWADATIGEWTDAERERADDLRERKYDHDRWVRERDDPTA